MKESQTYSTTDIFFAAALWCALGEESLVQIASVDKGTRFGNGVKKYSFCVPSLEEAAAMYADFLQNNLGVADLREYARIYCRLTSACKQMQRDGEDTYEGPGWILGRG